MNTIGKYKIVKELGSGGFGAVYLCEDQLGLQVAIKIFQPKDDVIASAATSATSDAGNVLKQRFKEEAKILHQLSDNTYIVNFMHYDELEDGTPYYVMPYLDRSLVEEIGKDAFSAGAREDLDPEHYPRKLPIARALEVLQQTTQALRAVHRAGLVHRDVKPANILLDKSGQVQLCDFGIAKLPDTEHSQSGVGMGSRNYMSPEQRESAKHVTASSDIYSLGVIAYRIVTGTLPVGHFDLPIALSPNIGQGLNDLILKSLSFEAKKRPKDAQAFLQELKNAGSGADSVTPVEDEGTGTWVEAGNAGLKDELLPLRDKIAELLKAHGEVPQAEKTKLAILAEMADLNAEQLDALIEETYQSIASEVKPKRKFLEVLDNKLGTSGTLNDSEHEALTSAATSIGWDEDTLNTLIEQRKPKSNNEKNNQAKQSPNKANKRKTTKPKPNSIKKQEPETKEPKPLGLMIGLLSVAALIIGVWWYNTLQAEQTETAQQSISEEKQITTVEKNRLKEESDQQEAKAQGDAALAQRQAIEAAAKREAEAEKQRKEEAYVALVKSTQSELNRIGYAVGRADGALGNKTRNAIKQYQKENNLSATGETNESLLAHLKRATKKPGRTAADTFKNCSNCPQMVVIPAGSFKMGSTKEDDEKPVHRVSIAQPFAMGQYEVTWDEYQPCIDAGVCESEGDEGFGKGNRPVINVSWNDAQTYAKWLSKKTGKHYRLPSESEWEYAARAGSITQYSWGNSISCTKAQYNGGENSNCYYKKSDGSYRGTARVGSFSANAFGLYDMHGNVFEWVQDCYEGNYNKATRDGGAYEGGSCEHRVLRGGSWDSHPEYLRSAYRNYNGAASRSFLIGFRLAQDL